MRVNVDQSALIAIFNRYPADEARVWNWGSRTIWYPLVELRVSRSARARGQPWGFPRRVEQLFGVIEYFSIGNIFRFISSFQRVLTIDPFHGRLIYVERSQTRFAERKKKSRRLQRFLFSSPFLSGRRFVLARLFRRSVMTFATIHTKLTGIIES